MFTENGVNILNAQAISLKFLKLLQCRCFSFSFVEVNIWKLLKCGIFDNFNSKIEQSLISLLSFIGVGMGGGGGGGGVVDCDSCTNPPPPHLYCNFLFYINFIPHMIQLYSRYRKHNWGHRETMFEGKKNHNQITGFDLRLLFPIVVEVWENLLAASL